MSVESEGEETQLIYLFVPDGTECPLFDSQIYMGTLKWLNAYHRNVTPDSAGWGRMGGPPK